MTVQRNVGITVQCRQPLTVVVWPLYSSDRTRYGDLVVRAELRHGRGPAKFGVCLDHRRAESRDGADSERVRPDLGRTSASRLLLWPPTPSHPTQSLNPRLPQAVVVVPCGPLPSVADGDGLPIQLGVHGIRDGVRPARRPWLPVRGLVQSSREVVSQTAQRQGAAACFSQVGQRCGSEMADMLRRSNIPNRT